MYPAADPLTYMPTTLRSTPPRSGWPLRKRSIMIFVEVSQQAFSIMSGSHLFNMFVLFVLLIWCETSMCNFMLNKPLSESESESFNLGAK